MKLIECPRDAIQGIKHFIPTQQKVDYLNYLLSLNLFDTLDFGSFVSPKAMPQMADTKEVVQRLNVGHSTSKLLAIVANERGAADAVQFDEITYLGFPFSVSETFQRRNTNSSVEESVETVRKMQELCFKNHKTLVVYLSMAFGNPYGDAWDEHVLSQWTGVFQDMGVQIISLSDTVGVADERSISRICKTVVHSFPGMQIGVHLHTTPGTASPKIRAAHQAGIRRFDGALAGYGGCPMAADDLVGNMPTEQLLNYFGMATEPEIGEMKSRFLELVN